MLRQTRLLDCCAVLKLHFCVCVSSVLYILYYSSANGTVFCIYCLCRCSHVFGAVDKTSYSFSVHGKIGNFIHSFVSLCAFSFLYKMWKYFLIKLQLVQSLLNSLCHIYKIQLTTICSSVTARRGKSQNYVHGIHLVKIRTTRVMTQRKLPILTTQWSSLHNMVHQM